MTFIDLRDRYGITQLAFNEAWDNGLLEEARKLGANLSYKQPVEVIERSSKNPTCLPVILK
jgi:aspartyl-tRNA synthetase